MVAIENGGKKLGLDHDYVTSFNLYTRNKIFAAELMLKDDADFDEIIGKTQIANTAIAALQAKINQTIESVNSHSDAIVDAIFKMNKDSQTMNNSH